MERVLINAPPTSRRVATALIACLLAGCAGSGPAARKPVTATVPASVKKIDAHQTALAGHQRAVLMARFSPDGQLILTTSEDGTARLWLATSGHSVASLTGHRRAVTCGAFSPDGETVVTGSDDRTARLWTLKGTALAVLRGHKKSVTSVTFSPDGKTVLTTSMDNTARLWRRDGQPLAVLKGHGDYVQAASFSPDGKTIVTASMDGTARLWRLDTSGTLPAAYRPGRGPDHEGQPVNKPFDNATGVPECDDYLAKFMLCMSTSSRFPAAARVSVERSLLQMAHSWRQSSTTPSGRRALAQACKQALVAAKRSMASFGCKW